MRSITILGYIALMLLNNKVVLITGASSGIGKALAEEALKRGARIALCARNLKKLESHFPPSATSLCVSADVSKEQDCKHFIKAAIEKYGQIDLLINNAGISMRALFEEADLSVLQELMNVNFWGTVFCTKYALGAIKKSNGTIIGISSIAGYRGLPGRTGYSASKFAMQGFLEALRTELLQTQVHVMWAAPGFTSSNIRNVARSASGAAQKETPLDENKLMSAEQCAKIIFDAAHKRKRTVVMTMQGKITVFLSKFFPSLLDKLVFNHFLNEADSPLQSKTNKIA